MLHPVPIFFKGKGFYSTDYGRGGRKRDSRDGEAAKSADGAKKAEKADAQEGGASLRAPRLARSTGRLAALSGTCGVLAPCVL